MKRWQGAALSALLLAGCATDRGGSKVESGSAEPVASGERYAMSSDAYPQEPPDVSQVPDAVPRIEAPSRGGNRPSYQVWGKTYHVLDDASGYHRDGTASWYGKKFHGYATSNGEIYDMYKMSAAHRSLPLPTYARVTNRDNGRSVILRVNDRGPFHSEREIDLSYAAAARLGILDAGTGRVRVEAIDARRWLAENQPGSPPPVVAQSPQSPSTSIAPAIAAAPVAAAKPRQPAPVSMSSGSEPIYLQVAALGSAASAGALEARLASTLDHPVRIDSAAGLYRVQVGPVDGPSEAESLRSQLRSAGFDKTFVVQGGE